MIEDARVNGQGPCGRREVLAKSGDENGNCHSAADCRRLLQYGNLPQFTADCYNTTDRSRS
jgi:hypothetical protein